MVQRLHGTEARALGAGESMEPGDRPAYRAFGSFDWKPILSCFRVGGVPFGFLRVYYMMQVAE